MSELGVALGWFLAWTLMVYATHFTVHRVPLLRDWHWDHHNYVTTQGNTGWNWQQLFLCDGQTWKSTVDMWIIEVIPTTLFCWLSGQWWIGALYYFYAAFLQEQVEHHPNIDLPGLTMGKWHLRHHDSPSRNYGLFLPIWDKLFGTEWQTRH